MSLLVAHDYFGVRGGAERVVLNLAQALGADLMFGYRTADSYGEELFPDRTIDLRVPPLFRGSGVRLAALSAAFASRRRRAGKYPRRVFSGSAALFAAPKRSEPGRNIFYCHSPARYLYDQESFFAHRGSLPLRFRVAVLADHYRRSYERAVEQMHVIVANSETVRDRIERYLGRESVVVHPPCDTASFKWLSQGDYYLSTARLAPLKRVDMIVRAFRKMPDKKLIVASGGQESDSLRALAAGAANISFTGWNSESELRRLVGGAIATIYVPIEEDFGLSPVESMAAGKPCIRVAEGGPRETILPGATGVLVPTGFDVDDLVDAVRDLHPDRAAGMRRACEARADVFSRQKFVDAMRAIVFAEP